MNRVPDDHLFHFEPDRPHDWDERLVDPLTPAERRRERVKLAVLVGKGILLLPVFGVIAAGAVIVGAGERIGRALR